MSTNGDDVPEISMDMLNEEVTQNTKFNLLFNLSKILLRDYNIHIYTWFFVNLYICIIILL